MASESSKNGSPNVRVVVRCRPLSEREMSDGYESIVHFEGSNKIVVNESREQPASKQDNQRQSYSRTYDFHAVYNYNSTQEDIYGGVCAPIVASTLEGYNGTIFAYGQTGTGKTYTMEGPGGRLRAERRRKSSKNLSTTNSATILSSSGIRKQSIGKPSSALRKEIEHRRVSDDGKGKEKRKIIQDVGTSKDNLYVSRLEVDDDDDDYYNDETEKLGVIPRAFRQIFNHIATKRDEAQFLVRASYLQLYQEELHDLLRPPLKQVDSQFNPRQGVSMDGRTKSANKLELHERADTGVYVDGLTSVVCKSITEIERVMRVGNKNRAVGATDMNEYSSRSHAIFMITIEQQLKNLGLDDEKADAPKKDSSNNVIKVGKLNLIDLAGSERQRKTNSLGERQRESVKINLSLSALGNVINSLMKLQRQQPKNQTETLASGAQSLHVPYRDSKLTRLMQDSLGGNSKTLMIAHIGPASYNYDETVNTLNYASRAKLIRNKPRLNEDPKDALLRELQIEINELRSKLASIETTEDLTIKNKRQESSEIYMNSSPKEDKIAVVSDFAENQNASQELAELRNKLRSLESKLLNSNTNNSNQINHEDNELRTDLFDPKTSTVSQLSNGRRLLSENETNFSLNHELLQAHTQSQELELKKSRAELANLSEREKTIRDELMKGEELELVTKESFTSIQQELEAKKRLIRQILSKISEIRDSISNKQTSQRLEFDELDQLQFNLIKELKLKCLIMDNFIPNEHVSQILSRIDYDDRSSQCIIRPLCDLPDLSSGDKGCRLDIIREIRSNETSNTGTIRVESDMETGLSFPRYSDTWESHSSIRPRSEFEITEETISPACIRFKYENLIQSKVFEPKITTRLLRSNVGDIRKENPRDDLSSFDKLFEAALNQKEPDTVLDDN